MNKKYLLLILAPITIIASFSIIAYYSDPCNFNVCFNAEFFANHEKYVEEMKYAHEQAGTYYTEREGSVYSDHHGDLELIIEHLKKQKADGNNIDYIQKITNANHTDVWRIFHEKNGDVEETIRMINELKN